MCVDLIMIAEMTAYHVCERHGTAAFASLANALTKIVILNGRRRWQSMLLIVGLPRPFAVVAGPELIVAIFFLQEDERDQRAKPVVAIACQEGRPSVSRI